MKKIFGLDIGVNSIGWAVVEEAESPEERSRIVDAGVRVTPLSAEEASDFEKGNPITVNADRRIKRGMRRRIHRYKLRRKRLIETLKSHGVIDPSRPLAEDGKDTTHQLWRLRARAATEQVALHDLARILLAINKKRGYKSNRKAQSDEESGEVLDFEVARRIHEEKITPGQYALRRLEEGKRYIPSFFPSDLLAEFDRIWQQQRRYHPDRLTHALYERLRGVPAKATFAILREAWGIEGIKIKGKRADQELQKYQWRVRGLSEPLRLEELAVVFQHINAALNRSSEYLGKISDRSKQLQVQGLTVGQYLYEQIKRNPHTPLKNQVFFRQDYIEEFETIWNTQQKFYPEVLTEELRRAVRDEIIFYQRPLKSQKGTLGICELEGRRMAVTFNDGGVETRKVRRVGPPVIPRSSPLFQQFKVWQVLNNLRIIPNGIRGEVVLAEDDQDVALRTFLFEELDIKGKMKASEVLRMLSLRGFSQKEWRLNYDEVEGNNTHRRLYEAYREILMAAGYDAENLFEKRAADIKADVRHAFEKMGIDTRILDFDPLLPADEFVAQPSYQLWHLLYSYEGDNSKSGVEKLIGHLQRRFGFPEEAARILAKVTFEDDYGSYSARAIRKILPHLQNGLRLAEAVEAAGYTWQEKTKGKTLKKSLPLFPRNSLRSPVVEKILNQVINIVNTLIERYGNPDEIRIELARELKKSAKERKRVMQNIEKNRKENEKLREELRKIPPFNRGVRITRNDLIRYKLWKELSPIGHQTIYTGTPVPIEQLFTNKFDIDHIIPQSRLFDDSYANKVLATRQFNLLKGNRTGLEAVRAELGEAGEQQYRARIDRLVKDGAIPRAKRERLLWMMDNVPDDFIDRDLRLTQYINRKAREILQQVTPRVTATSGAVTDLLRADWGLLNVLKELNIEKYRQLGMVRREINKEGQTVEVIEGWTKRDDHRHHAVDAIVVAFTTPAHIQYLNRLNALAPIEHGREIPHELSDLYAIQQKITERDERGKRRFRAPFPHLREAVRKMLERILISHKAKNKVVTRNKNFIRVAKNHPAPHKVTRKGRTYLVQHTRTPRGPLHKETIYGRVVLPRKEWKKIGKDFDEAMIRRVVDPAYRRALLQRLREFENNPRKAFTGKNALTKNPIFIDEHRILTIPEKVEVWTYDRKTTKRVPVDPNLDRKTIERKVFDPVIRQRLLARLEAFDGNPKEAFSDLEKNPIWLDEKAGIAIKRVTLAGGETVRPLHIKHDHHGQPIPDENGRPRPADYVWLRNNHHVAIYQDPEGKLHERVVSFFEAVERKNQGLPVVDREYNRDKGWQLLMTLKKNEMFVFPNPDTGFDPRAIDLTDEANYHRISPNLFRVQTISSKDFRFAHHLETQAITKEDFKNEKLKRVKYYRLRKLQDLLPIVKVRLNHLGKIVQVGEY